jgi:hypothetical protein
VRRRTFNSKPVCARSTSAGRRRSRVACNQCWAAAHPNTTAADHDYLFNVRVLSSYSALQQQTCFDWRFFINLSTADFFRLAFLHPPFNSRLASADVSSSALQ